VIFTYEVGYHSYEESEYHQFWSNTEYSKEEFDSIVETVIAKIAATIVKPKSIYDSERDPKFMDVLCHRKNKRIKGVVKNKNVFIEEIKKYGLHQIKFTQSWGISGWDLCVNINNNSYSTSERYLNIVKRIRKMFLKLKKGYLRDVKIGKMREKKYMERTLKKG